MWAEGQIIKSSFLLNRFEWSSRNNLEILWEATLTAPTGQFCFRLFMTFTKDIRSASPYRSTPLDVFNQVVHLDRLQ